ncbi:MAG: hypothetical protein RJB62_201 [Pseudomonadota bacterium]
MKLRAAMKAQGVSFRIDVTIRKVSEARLDPFFAVIENSALSLWLRSSSSLLAFPGVLVLHALGMGALAGGSLAIALRVLGVARGVPLAAIRQFYPVFWVGLSANVFSGVLLLTAYPTKALTNPVFFVKMLFVFLAVTATLWLRDLANDAAHSVAPSDRAKMLAAAAILFWIAAIFAGRFLAYTHTRLLVDTPVYF